MTMQQTQNRWQGSTRILWQVVLFALCIASFARHAEAGVERALPELAAVQQAVGALAVPFEQNRGQFDSDVAYLARTFAGSAFVTHDGRLVYSLPGKLRETEADATVLKPGHSRRQHRAERGPGWVLQERLLGSRPLSPRGTVKAVTHVTRLTSAGSFQADTWQGVRLGEAWPGIEVELAARGSNFEKLFHLAPGADPQQIRLALQGAEGLRVADDGRLIVQTGNGEIAYTAPVAWQEIDGKRQPVEVRYALQTQATQTAEPAYGFALGKYDPRHPLTIDPLLQSTYLGGSGDELIRTLALASNGDVLVAGMTTSEDLPGTANGIQPNYGGGSDDGDGFVARLSGDLRTLLQSTYLGGSRTDSVNAMTVASNGDVLVAGWTRSEDLPGTANGAQPNSGDSYFGDGFVARLSEDLRTLLQSTYLGGSDFDWINILTLASNGDVLVGGWTRSEDLPGRANGAQPNGGGGYDGFVARLSGDLRTLLQSTYLGGSDYNEIRTLTLASNGDVLVGGWTGSWDLPGRADGAQPNYGGGCAFRSI